MDLLGEDLVGEVDLVGLVLLDGVLLLKVLLGFDILLFLDGLLITGVLEFEELFHELFSFLDGLLELPHVFPVSFAGLLITLL